MQRHIGARFHRISARPGNLVVLCWTLILFSCSPVASGQIAASPSPQIASSAMQAHEIRFGLVGNPTEVNVWSLFDEAGASYANYALRWEYWPRLYTLSIPEFEFIPQAALGQPSKMIRDGEYYVATVKMRDDLNWSDGLPFTAEDAAFTISTALAFELGFDWKEFYDLDYLDRVEQESASTLQYFFKQTPHVGVWQYGALQGPIVQKSYWEPKIKEAIDKLPDSSIAQEITDAEAGKTTLEKEVNDLTNRINLLRQIGGGQDRQMDAALKRAQANLDAANNSISKLNDERREEFNQARLALYSLDDTGEPTLGNWMPQGENEDVWMNAVNTNFPFLQPHFVTASYSTFKDENRAVSALQANDVDLILQPHGLSAEAVAQLEREPSIRLMQSPSRSTQFLILNPANPVLSNQAIRQAIACMLANGSSSETYLEKYPFNGLFTMDRYWQTTSNIDGCSTLTNTERFQKATGLLKRAGYSWRVEPKPGAAGASIILPDGTEPPQISIAAPVSDPFAEESAQLVKEMLTQFGISAVTSIVDVREINYAVFSSGDYDMAILSWNLSPYPSYLCDWFTGTHTFLHAGQELEAECASLIVETDLEQARAIIQEVQEVLYQDAQLIPLMTELRFDAYRNITIPFENIVNGLSGVFGAASRALPAP
jgi:ABC-type transport system substrate-binding protein